jgi:hypothetical protein
MANPANSTTVTLTAVTEAHVTSAEFYQTAVIYNQGAGTVTIQFDGTVLAGVGGQGSYTLASGAQQAFANMQPLPQWAKLPSSNLVRGGTAQPTNLTSAPPWFVGNTAVIYGTPQQFYTPGTGTESTPTYLSLYSAGTPTVTITLQ